MHWYKFLNNAPKRLFSKTQNGIVVAVQGDPNQSLLIQMTITLKICIFDPMEESQSVFWRYVCFSNVGSKCIFSELEPFDLTHLYLGHPVVGGGAVSTTLQSFTQS